MNAADEVVDFGALGEAECSLLLAFLVLGEPDEVEVFMAAKIDDWQELDPAEKRLHILRLGVAVAYSETDK